MSRARTLRTAPGSVEPRRCWGFAEALEELLPLLDVDRRTPGGSQQWHPREGREVEAVQLAAKVDFAAGPAALAFNDAGVFVS